MTTKIAPPTSQANKVITFKLSGGGTTISLDMPINPQELQRTQPARITTTQTLGGIYQDISGTGVMQITMTGNTGWRKRGNSPYNGFQIAQILYKDIYEEFYKRSAIDPSKVELLLINNIDGYTWKVSIDDFQMARSSSAPLLFTYTLTMTVLQNMHDPPASLGDPIISIVTNKNGNSSAANSDAGSHTTAKTRTYIVKAGDNLWNISVKFYGNGTKDMKIASTNHIKAPYIIYPGQKLTIPA